MKNRRSSFPLNVRTKGFTLIEVLVAMALIAIILPASMYGVSILSTATNTARHRAEATMLGEGKLQELIGAASWNQTTQSGDFGEEWPEYKWLVQISNRDLDLIEMKIQVYWKFRNEEQSLWLTTLVYTATSSGATTTQ